ncbi:hypothetical protein JD974_21835 [Chromobacterium haemolyticum]|uniref:Uncharacterized protein n=1 Tax=Chromobacterium haemolyticum TaxID=394935 RepID=A0ABS3GU37_9NEIS|nr:hypothetical protein [Chromobacterium haemolyticum]MBK0417051.1 hypothetical protein [Chromobacterium haemolyticum]MBO0418177.1 hypothetical protein [Chromobacterium haemolyticum]MBO0501430.1 hypothetical protein [Chromobacterium haemolyticum]
MTHSNRKRFAAALALAAALPLTAHAETFDLGAILKDGIKKALQKDTAADGAAAPMAPGIYDGSDKQFARTLTIRPNGKFELEVMQKGKPGQLRSGSGSGQLQANGGQWRYSEGICTMNILPQTSAVQVQMDRCASAFGDVPFDGVYRLAKAAGGAQAGAGKNKALAAQLSCHNLNLSDNGVAKLLAAATGSTPNQVWEHELALPSGYDYGDLPIRSAQLSEADGGFLALFVDGDAAAIKSAIKKTQRKSSSAAMLSKVGESYPFPGKPNGLPYVLCRSKAVQHGLY